MIRLSLRLENLFSRLDIVFACNPEKQTQTLIALLIDILNVLDRPDLKGKFAKEFYRLITVFEKLEGDSNANQDALAETLEQLRTLTKYFVNVPGKIAQSLRNNELIAIIRQNFLKLGGSSIFDAPPYFYWLEQPWETQENKLIIGCSPLQKFVKQPNYCSRLYVIAQNLDPFLRRADFIMKH